MTRRGRLGGALVFVLEMSAALPARKDVDPNTVRARMHACRGEGEEVY